MIPKDFTTNSYESLCKLGLTQNESKIFLYLAQNPESNGYEISKNTGISRSLVYGALEKMRSSGFIELTQTNSSSYILKPLDEIHDIIHNDMNNAFVELGDILANMQRRESEEIFITLPEMRQQIIKLQQMVKSAKKSLFISAGMNELEWIWKTLVAVTEEVDVHIFSLAKIPDIPERFHIYSKDMEDSFIQSVRSLQHRWRILLIKDREEMMLCGGSKVMSGMGIYTKNNMMVTFATEHFLHDVKISNIEKKYSIEDYTESMFDKS